MMLKDLNGAVSLLTIIPTPDFYPDKPGRAYTYFPLVGVLIGGILWLVHALLSRMFPVEIAAFGVTAAWVLITGGLHLDGFGDACDGLFAAVSPQRRLEIMKDPRTGTWAVLGLILLLLGKWTAIQSVQPALLILAAMSARWVMVIAAVSFPYARAQGMGSVYREGFGRKQVIIATVIFAFTMLVFWRYSLYVGVVLLLIAGVARWAAGRLNGGLTGDTYGALCELTELLVLISVVSL